MQKTVQILMSLLVALALLIQLVPTFTASAEEVIGAVRVNSGSNAKVRDRASFDGKNVGEAKAGREYDLLENTGEWYKIRVDEKTVGWIYNSTAQVIEKKEGSASKAEPAATPAPTAAPKASEKTAQAAPISVSLGALLHGKSVLLAEQGGLTISVTDLQYSSYDFITTLSFVLEVSNANDKAVLVDFDSTWEGILLNGNRYECTIYDQGKSNRTMPASFTIEAQTEGKRYSMDLIGYEFPVPKPEEIENGEFNLTVFDPQAKSVLGGITYDELFTIGSIRFDMAYDGPIEESANNLIIPITQVESREDILSIEYEPISVDWLDFTITIEKAGWYIHEYYGEQLKFVSVFGTLENRSSKTDVSWDDFSNGKYGIVLIGTNDFKKSHGSTIPSIYDINFDLYGDYDNRNEHRSESIPAGGTVYFNWSDSIQLDESFSETDCYIAFFFSSKSSEPFRFVEQ